MNTHLCPCFSLWCGKEQKGLDSEECICDSPMPAASVRLHCEDTRGAVSWVSWARGCFLPSQYLSSDNIHQTLTRWARSHVSQEHSSLSSFFTSCPEFRADQRRLALHTLCQPHRHAPASFLLLPRSGLSRAEDTEQS